MKAASRLQEKLNTTGAEKGPNKPHLPTALLLPRIPPTSASQSDPIELNVNNTIFKHIHPMRISVRD